MMRKSRIPPRYQWCVVPTATLVTLLFLCSCCHALRGSFPKNDAPRFARRMLMMMDDDYFTQAPSNPPSPFPSLAPSQKPSSLAPSITQEPLPPPTLEPSTSQAPTTSQAPSVSLAPSARNLVSPLADFAVEYMVGSFNDENSMLQATEDYLLESLQSQYDSLASIELAKVTMRRRRLQESTMTTAYSGTAVFGAFPIPPTNQVQQSQTVALQDTTALQTAYDEMDGVNIVVNQVVVQQSASPPPNDGAALSVGVIAGVSVAAAVLLALAIAVCYKVYQNRHEVIDLDSSRESRDDYVKYTPNDFEPAAPTQSNPTEEDKSIEDESIEVSIDFDEFSLSAASADSSTKKDPEQRRESLLQKLALYQKTEKKEETIMPVALFVPQVVARDASELTTPTAVAEVTQASRAVSLLDQSSNSMEGHASEEEEEEEEEDILPPPVPHSTGNSSQWALDTASHQIVPSENGSKSQWSLSPTRQMGEDPSNVETQLVPVQHDFPSTTWAHPMPIPPSQTRSYSDGPSDEMNAVMEQDLANFQLQPYVSPEQSYLDTPPRSPDATPVRRTRSTSKQPESPPPMPASPERGYSKPPRDDDYGTSQQDVAQVTPPPHSRRSSSRSRRGPEVKEVEPPPNAQRRRQRSSSSRRRTSSSNSRRRTSYEDDNVSYDGSYASNGSEVIEDLNGLSDFLRERREAKRAQRQARAQASVRSSRR